jgi:hypothetical protein
LNYRSTGSHTPAKAATDKKKGRPKKDGPAKQKLCRNPNPLSVSGQCAEVLELLRNEGAVLSFQKTPGQARGREEN